MDITTIPAKIRSASNTFFILSLTTFLSTCLISFVAVATMFLCFVVAPVCLVFGVPIKLTILTLRPFRRLLYIITDYLFGTKTVYYSPPNSRLGTPHPRRTRRLSAPGVMTPSPRFNELQLELDFPVHIESAPSHEDIQGVVFNTFDQIRNSLNIGTDLDLEPSPNVLGMSLYESPVDYRPMHPPFPKVHRPIEFLPEVVEELVKYLSPSTISALALVSRKISLPFRFRRVHSGTEYVSLPTFSQLARQPHLGGHVRNLTIHQTFYNPAIKVQWLLEGSDPAVAQASWESTEHKKLALLTAVMDACDRISSLTWNEGQLTLPPCILDAVETRLTHSLRHLDIHANCSQLLIHLPQAISQQAESISLESVTVRGGFDPKSFIDIGTLLTMTKRTLRQLRFVDTKLSGVQPRLAELLHELPNITCLEFINPTDLNTLYLPLTTLGQLTKLDVLISNPITTSGSPKLNFTMSSLHTLAHLTSLILNLPTYDILWTNDGSGQSSTRLIYDVVAVATNLRVFSCSAPTLGRHSNTEYENHFEVFAPVAPYKLVEGLCNKYRLVSLSIMSWMLTNRQLRTICEKLSRLQHLAVYMQGEPRDISRYSSSFAKLPNLVALDVAISPSDTSCPCGHELDPRIPHTAEGTALGRLCRRFRAPTSVKVVRLSQDGWFPEPVSRWTFELHWVEPVENAVDDLEVICGPCHDYVDAARKVFAPVTWRAAL